MTTCNINIKLDNFGPKEKDSIPFNDMECLFKNDAFKSTIKVQDHNKGNFNQKINNIRKDIKYNIHVNNTKTSSLIGLSEFTIPFSLIKKGQNFSYNKKCLLTIIDSIKRELFGSVVNCPTIFFEISANITIISNNSRVLKKNVKSQSFLNPKKADNTINFLSPKTEKSPNTKFNLSIEIQKEFPNIKTPPSRESRNDQNRLYKVKSNFNKKRSYLNDIQIKQKKPFQNAYSNTITVPTSASKIHSKMGFDNDSSNNKKDNSPSKKEDTDINNDSEIDNILIEEDKEVSQEDKQKEKELTFKIERQYDEGKEVNNVITAQTLLKKQANLLLDYQLLFQRKFKELINIKNSLTDTLLKNDDKLRNTKKKQHKLDELKEKTDIMKEITVNVNKTSSDKIISKQIHVKKGELKLFQHILNKFYFEYDILKYSETQKVLNLDSGLKSKLLLSCLHAVINSYGGVTNLLPKEDENELTNIKVLLKNYGIVEPFMQTFSKVAINQEKIKAITEEDAEDEEDDLENSSGSKNKTTFDKIKRMVDEFNSKHKLKTPFIQTKQDQYQYDTLNITMKLLDDKLNVIDNGDIIPIEKFIEVKNGIKKKNFQRHKEKKAPNKVIKRPYTSLIPKKSLLYK